MSGFHAGPAVPPAAAPPTPSAPGTTCGHAGASSEGHAAIGGYTSGARMVAEEGSQNPPQQSNQAMQPPWDTTFPPGQSPQQSSNAQAQQAYSPYDGRFAATYAATQQGQQALQPEFGPFTSGTPAHQQQPQWPNSAVSYAFPRNGCASISLENYL